MSLPRSLRVVICWFSSSGMRYHSSSYLPSGRSKRNDSWVVGRSSPVSSSVKVLCCSSTSVIWAKNLRPPVVTRDAAKRVVIQPSSEKRLLFHTLSTRNFCFLYVSPARPLCQAFEGLTDEKLSLSIIEGDGLRSRRLSFKEGVLCSTPTTSTSNRASDQLSAFPIPYSLSGLSYRAMM